jgi:hypothetical protein
MSKVHEIAIRIVKPGKEESFANRRSEFIRKLKTQKGVLADREFESFLALPTPDERPVYVGMTTYENLDAVSRVQYNPLVMFKFVPFFMTMNLKAYVFAKQTSGPDLNLATLAAQPGEVLQISVRKTHPDNKERFEKAQARFLELLLARDSAGQHYELSAVKGFGDVSGITVGLTSFASEEAFSETFDALAEHEVTQAYFDTFTPLASQFARTAKNS